MIYLMILIILVVIYAIVSKKHLNIPSFNRTCDSYYFQNKKYFDTINSFL